MNLAILHYHLNRGGVTRVVENQLAALDAVLDRDRPLRVALIFGGRKQGWNEELPGRLRRVRLELHEAPALDYDDVRKQHARRPAEDPYTQLAALLERLDLPPSDTVLHVHNHSLGKNSRLPQTVARLARDGYALLLQIHDFAEDLRPHNYQNIVDPAGLYPQAPQVHYAVLNGRDHGVLHAAGVDPGRLHLLPNPVPPRDDLPPRADARRRLAERFGVAPQQQLILYPVRGIRRKNLGEALLYAALAARGTVVGVTLAPLNPAELPVYERWKHLAAELELPCRFELGAPGALSFAENLAAADLILTTSLAEGFGMVFLEAWLAGSPLAGRELPEITADFTALGLRFDSLRPRLDVPVEWIGIDDFRHTVLDAYRRTLKAYGRAKPGNLPGNMIAQLDARIHDGLVDFGDLDEALQARVLRRVCGDPADRQRVLHCNRWIERAMSMHVGDAAEAIAHNARVIAEHFSAVPSGRRLYDLYRQVAASGRSRRIEQLPARERILERFLNLERFRPIRC